MTRFSRNLFSILLILSLAACSRSPQKNRSSDVTGAPIEIKSYGKALFALDPMNLEQGLDSLVREYRFFLGDQIDTLKVLQIRDFIIDPLNRQLATDCELKFHDVTFLSDGLGELFLNARKSIRGFSDPEVYTYVSGLLYESPVQYIDSVLIIGLDMFLGKNYEPYHAFGLPLYLTRRMDREYIIPECAHQLAISLIPGDTDPKTLVDNMILEGKILYAMDVLLPDTPDSLKIGYTGAQVNWCLDNEKNLWQLMIDQELLFSADPMVLRKFMQDGPFTAGLPEGAPAMLGKWIGWQIVKSYMLKHDKVTLNSLFMDQDAPGILSQSGFKPRK